MSCAESCAHAALQGADEQNLCTLRAILCLSTCRVLTREILFPHSPMTPQQSKLRAGSDVTIGDDARCPAYISLNNLSSPPTLCITIP